MVLIGKQNYFPQVSFINEYYIAWLRPENSVHRCMKKLIGCIREQYFQYKEQIIPLSRLKTDLYWNWLMIVIVYNKIITYICITTWIIKIKLLKNVYWLYWIQTHNCAWAMINQWLKLMFYVFWLFKNQCLLILSHIIRYYSPHK